MADTSQEEQRYVETQVKPFIIGLTLIGLFGLAAIVIVALAVEEVSTFAVISGIIVTFCGTVISTLMLLTKLNEGHEHIHRRFDEVVEAVKVAPGEAIPPPTPVPQKTVS